jgi:hypothetical protein
MVVWPKFVISLVILILLSVPIMSWLITFRTWIQTHSPSEFRGRVFGGLETFNAILMLVGMGFASGVGDIIGISTTLYISVGIYIISGILAIALLHKIETSAKIANEAIFLE